MLKTVCLSTELFSRLHMAGIDYIISGIDAAFRDFDHHLNRQSWQPYRAIQLEHM